METAPAHKDRVVLEKVVIKGFRSCEDVTLADLGPSLVLVGKNGVGKTNILKAILWAAETALRAEPLTPVLPVPDISLEFRVGNDRYRYAIESPRFVLNGGSVPGSPRPTWSKLRESVCQFRGGEWDELVDRRGSELRLPERELMSLAETTPALPFLLAYLHSADPLWGHLHLVRDFLGHIRYYPLDEPNERNGSETMITLKDYEEFSLKLAGTGSVEDSIAPKLIYLKSERPEDFQEVKDLLGDQGLELVRDIQVQGVSTGRALHRPDGSLAPPEYPDDLYIVSFRPCGWAPENDQVIGFPALSVGTRRIIRMIVSMIFDKSSVMLIEHPEDGIHRRLTEKVFDVFQAYTDPSQIIVSSHSSLVFNMLDPAEIRLVSMQDGKTEVRALTEEEADEARSYVKEQGTLTEYLDVLIEQ
jgi:hypothetical protein